jgi:hypothetical protein
MPMNPRLLRPLARIVAALLTTISGQSLTTQSGQPLRTIQDA